MADETGPRDVQADSSLPPSSPLPTSSDPTPPQHEQPGLRSPSEDDPFGFFALEKKLKRERELAPPRPVLLARDSSVQSILATTEHEDGRLSSSDESMSDDEPIDPLVTPHKPHRNRKRKPLASPSLSRSSSLSSHPSIPSSPSPVKVSAGGPSPALVSPFVFTRGRPSFPQGATSSDAPLATTVKRPAPKQTRKGKENPEPSFHDAKRAPSRVEVLLPRRASRRANAAAEIALPPTATTKPKVKGKINNTAPASKKEKAPARRKAPARAAKRRRADPDEQVDDEQLGDDEKEGNGDDMFDEVPEGRTTRSRAKVKAASGAPKRAPKSRAAPKPPSRARPARTLRPRSDEGPSFVLDSDVREEFEQEKQKRITYFEKLKNYQLETEAVYVV
ncbi:hypothetical protein PUNSTDRAFT_127318 [Punctularia strigosozonata HHB-11173 SS5]|uniref:uncharacterized protein n=1 Tax=Punctularia strigosozonata (strain HHB-11173) TaxID=741275 RepID=UPI0004417EC8|nr:uncharacterized protein PUNSTDRAFT_127318 [Punctularia strigosozonata HHB-11173 SS5]EIN06609.1 hypothetical protein PUNSTDRAFT_127318 [Punctularia strigosozonata HHB-11173 SS5]